MSLTSLKLKPGSADEAMIINGAWPIDIQIDISIILEHLLSLHWIHSVSLHSKSSDCQLSCLNVPKITLLC